MRVPLAPLLLSLAAGTGAMESFAVGPRALGMGGTGVACVNDIQAQYYNPAMFGFFSSSNENGERSSVDNQNLRDKTWGFGLDATVGLRIHDHFADYANTLKNVYDSNLVQNVQNGSYTLTPADVQKLADFANALQGIDRPEEFLTADVNGGFGVRILHVGIGVRVYGEVLARVSSIDYTHLGGNGVQGAVTQINAALAGPAPGPSATVITPAQSTVLQTAGLTPASVTQLNALAAQAGLTTDQIQPLVDLIQKTGNSPGTIGNNSTTVMLRGVAVAELPISYGYAINDHLAIGGNLKFMKGRLYGTSVRVFDDNAAGALHNARNQYQDSAAFSVDVGLSARTELFQAGVVGRNLTRPTFKGFDATTVLGNGTPIVDHIDDYTLDPSAAAGVAFIPASWVTLAADLDLTRNKTLYPDYKTQNLGLGGELNLLHFLALRAGVSKNLAESDIGMLYTLGVGINLWLLRIDAAGAMSKAKTTFDGKDYPREARGSLQVAVDF